MSWAPIYYYNRFLSILLYTHVITAPVDYSPISNYCLTFPAQSSDNITYRVQIVDDRLTEIDENFKVVLSLPDSNLQGRITLGPTNETVITIMDNDSKKVWLIIGS